MRSRWTIACFAALAAACSSSSSAPSGDQGGSDTGSEVSNGDDTGSTDDVVAEADNPYPDGPYGTNVGDVMADVQLVGYAHSDSTALANTSDYLPTSLSQLRQTVTMPYGVLHVAEFW